MLSRNQIRHKASCSYFCVFGTVRNVCETLKKPSTGVIFLYVYGEQGNALGIKKQEHKSQELPGSKNETIYAQ